METVFHDRLPEFYETLAFHFRRGRSIQKAVDYLVKSGEKSLRRYAVDESHRYFEEAFDLLNREAARNIEVRGALIDLVIKWAFVHYYSGHYAKLLQLLEVHKPMAESLTDKSKVAMFHAWLGWTMWHTEWLEGAREHLCKALELGEEIKDLHVVGYACSWLTWTCADLGLLDEAAAFGMRASVSYLFKPRGVIVVDKAASGEDALIEAALDAGADDVHSEGEAYEVLTPPAQLEPVREALVALGMTPQSAEVTKIASLLVPVDAKTAESVLRLVDALEDNDDVQRVYANFNVPDEIMALLSR